MLDFLRRLLPKDSPLRNAWYLFKAVTAATMYGFPARKMDRLIGITGTDGKTTTVSMISSILREAGVPHLKISTASLFLNGREWENATKRTTLSPFLTQKLLRRALREGVKTAVLEVSSHATVQQRLWGISFDIAGITNITEEHLEDHGGFAAYAEAKKRLFTTYLKMNGTAILNADDPTITSWKETIQQKQIWVSAQGKEEADWKARAHSFTREGVSFSVDETQIHLPLSGHFNVENALVAFAVARILKIPPQVIAEGLRKFPGVAGRLEEVHCGQEFAVYIDDALTPNAISGGLRSLRTRTEGRIWAVFGCCGTRDQGKRPKIGRIVGELADEVVLTDDEPYTEPAEQIREQVKEGIASTKIWRTSSFREIPDRREAIHHALANARPGDAVFIFGMGSYTSRNIGGKEIPWSDKEVVREILTPLRTQK